MNKIKMSDVSEQIRGVSYKPEDVFDKPCDEAIGLLRANNINDGKINFDDLVYVNKGKVTKNQILKRGDILICASSGSKNLVGKAAQVESNCDYCFGAFCKVVRPKSINTRFLGMYFQSELYRNYISSVSQGVNINNIKNEHIDSIEIKGYSDYEQQEIADLLNKVRLLIDYRRKQLKGMDDLIKSRFVELFGDTYLNDNGYLEVKLGTVADIVSGITKGRKTSETQLKEVPYMAVSNVKDGFIDWTTVKTIAATQSEIEMYRLQTDDVLMTEGGDPDKVGRGAVINNPPTDCIHQNHIFRVRFDETRVHPKFFEYYLQGARSKSYFLGCAKQTTGIASINMTQLKNMPVLLPPIKKQNTFIDFVNQLDKSKDAIKKSLDETQLLFDSLMQQYFG